MVGFPKFGCDFCEGLDDKDCFLGSILGFLYSWKLPRSTRAIGEIVSIVDI